jgi:hypothetical protein
VEQVPSLLLVSQRLSQLSSTAQFLVSRRDCWVNVIRGACPCHIMRTTISYILKNNVFVFVNVFEKARRLKRRITVVICVLDVPRSRLR